MATTSKLSCTCRSFQAEVTDISPRKSTHLVCYCKHCQAFARHLGQDVRLLDELGGMDLLQIEPRQIRITKGHDMLAALRLTVKGPIRWYTNCCKTPLCNTLASPFPPFVSLMADNLSPKPDLGPVLLHSSTKHIDNKLRPTPHGKTAIAKVILRFLRRSLIARMNGSYKQTPFFDPNSKKPVAIVRPLTKQEKIFAYSSGKT
jgi:uncharacterized protein DUF6151